MVSPSGSAPSSSRRRLLTLLAVAPGVVIVLVAALVLWSPWTSAPPDRRGTTSTGGTIPTVTSSDVATNDGQAPTIVAAGDLACAPSEETEDDKCRHREVAAAVIAAKPAAFLALGDTQYEDGSAQAYRGSYDPAFGSLLPITHPVPGNHEYRTAGAAGYFGYFGSRAGERGKGYYSFEVGSWHLVALNSTCDEVACSAGSDQERWLRADLAAHPARCTLAFLHYPRWSGGEHGDQPQVGPLLQALSDGGADVLLAGHDHHYQRFAPRMPSGQVDQARGIREFVVGTGGRSLRDVRSDPQTEAATGDAFGPLTMTLEPGSYSWSFASVAGKTFSDQGSTQCH